MDDITGELSQKQGKFIMYNSKERNSQDHKSTLMDNYINDQIEIDDEDTDQNSIRLWLKVVNEAYGNPAVNISIMIISRTKTFIW